MATPKVTKRAGHAEDMDNVKLHTRITRQSVGLVGVDAALVTRKVVEGLVHNIPTKEIDTLIAETAAGLTGEHPDYSALAARIAVSHLHKRTSPSFADVCEQLWAFTHPTTKLRSPLIAEDVNHIVQENREVIEAAIVHERDFDFDYFGFKTMEKTYLMRMADKIVERPQYMFMRVAVGIHKADIAAVLETYELMSRKCFTHATPTLFNAGTPRPQMSSCFLVQMKDDSIEGIFDTLKTCACISKYAGGIGLSVHNIRATGSHIRGTNGTSNGLVPMLRVFSDTARYVDQGGGKRKGSIAVYLEPWHADVEDFLQLKKNHGAEEMRARDLFYALWIPDLFMKRVESNGSWSLFCPHEAPGLSDSWGEEFEKLYTSYESDGRARRVVSAQKLWFSILESQTETGTPYLLYKDACNRKSNHQHLGTIKSSNLCTEIIQYTSADEVAVCNLASICLPQFVDAATRTFNFDELKRVVKVVTRNLNKVIDNNFYPVEEALRSNMRHRPVGMGVQGLADTFFMLRMPYDSPEAAALNRDIFETIYFAALTASCELAKVLGPYESYPGSPVSRGVLQFDMWGVTPTARHDWAALRADIAAHGVRNSLLVAPMPTASTAQIFGNAESFEPLTSNIYSRRVMSGEFLVVNKHMVTDLIKLGLWTPAMRNSIVLGRGSIQHIGAIPAEVRALYKTVWELKMKTLIDMARDRGAFIDQSQSLNLYVADPTTSKLSSMHFYAWREGLKTGQYYLRTQSKAHAIQFTVDKTAEVAHATPVPGGSPDRTGVTAAKASSAPAAVASSATGAGAGPAAGAADGASDADSDADADEEEEPMVVCQYRKNVPEGEECLVCSS